MLLRSDVHARGGLPSHTVHGSLIPVIACATVFIMAVKWIIPHNFVKCNSFYKLFFYFRHLPLRHNKIIINAFFTHKLVVRAGLGDRSLVEHDKERGVAQS